MRSKVLCLSIIHTVLRDFMPVFTSPSVMLHASLKKFNLSGPRHERTKAYPASIRH